MSNEELLVYCSIRYWKKKSYENKFLDIIEGRFNSIHKKWITTIIIFIAQIVLIMKYLDIEFNKAPLKIKHIKSILIICLVK